MSIPPFLQETSLGRHQQDPVPLDEEERHWLLSVINKGESGVRTLQRAHMLLLASEGQNERQIAEALHACAPTVGNRRRQYAEGGRQAALHERLRPGSARKLAATGDATLLAWACSAPPEGRVDWPMQLLAATRIARHLVASISDATVRRTLKTMSATRGSNNRGAWAR